MPRKRKTAAELDRDIANALATSRYVRRRYANAWFRPDWNSWTIGYYTDGAVGGADSYTTAGSEAEAKRIADAYNATEEQAAKARQAAVAKAQRARARLK